MNKEVVRELDTVKTLREHGYEVCVETLDDFDVMCLKTPKTVLRDIETKTILYEDENEYRVVAKGLAYALKQSQQELLDEIVKKSIEVGILGEKADHYVLLIERGEKEESKEYPVAQAREDADKYCYQHQVLKELAEQIAQRHGLEVKE